MHVAVRGTLSSSVFMARNLRRLRVVFRSLLIWQALLTPSLDSSCLEACKKLDSLIRWWHCGARYCVEHDGRPRLIKVTEGVRQGCVIAPLLWLIYSHRISTELASLIGEAATKSLLNIYADDYHASLSFDSIHGLEVGLSHIGALFAVLGRLGMTISHSKSKAILSCRAKVLKA